MPNMVRHRSTFELAGLIALLGAWFRKVDCGGRRLVARSTKQAHFDSTFSAAAPALPEAIDQDSKQKPQGLERRKGRYVRDGKNFRNDLRGHATLIMQGTVPGPTAIEHLGSTSDDARLVGLVLGTHSHCGETKLEM